MKNIQLVTFGFVLALLFGFYPNSIATGQNGNSIDSEATINRTSTDNTEKMKLGAFSISLSVKDIKVSKQFYENLGFTVLGGALESNYLIMKNENSLIGLFQGMFENNILTFNPGWDENGNNIENFKDIREIQNSLKSNGIKMNNEIDPKTTGPASLVITDPDGNMILIDQHR